jgi:glycosyltransferase involved in cell wall biosynthesis
MKSVAVVVPCFNEAGNLELFFDRVTRVFDASPAFDWRVIFVDDHSSDDSVRLLRSLAARDPRIRWIRLAKNSGSHIAIRAGLASAGTDAVAVIAADLQDPPEMLSAMAEAWSLGSDIVWATRRRRKGESASTLICSKLYHFFMEKAAGVHIPPSGSDAFLLDRKAVDRVNAWKDLETSVLLFISSLGMSESGIGYDKEARHSGRSKWSLKKKWKLFIDSVFMFGNLPTRVFGIIGIFAFVGAAALFAAQLRGAAYALLVTAFVALCSMVITEYLRRILQKKENGPLWSLEK